MSKSLLYHGFGIRGYDFQRTDFEDGSVIFTIRQPRKTLCCSACGSQRVVSRGQVSRRFRSLPIGGKATFIRFAVPRALCRDCGVLRQVKIRFADRRRRVQAGGSSWTVQEKKGRRTFLRSVEIIT